jgi:Holliday junction resolvase-like predicted endonuclease
MYSNDIGRRFEAWTAQLFKDHGYNVTERRFRIREERRGQVVNDSEIDLIIEESLLPGLFPTRYAVECKYRTPDEGVVSRKEIADFGLKLRLPGSPTREGFVVTNTGYVEQAQAAVRQLKKDFKVHIRLYSREDLERLDYQRLNLWQKRNAKKGKRPSLEEQIQNTRI